MANGKGISRANKERGIRQEELRRKLAAQGHEQHLIETLKKIADLDEELDSLEIQRLRAAADIRLKIMNKYLPDLKQNELTGPDGGSLVLEIKRKRFDGAD